MVVGVFNQDTGELLRPLDVATQNTYVQDIQRLAQEFKPKYLGIGIEINILYEHSQADFDTFVSLFETADIAVKQVSPATKVFTVFQLEHLKGLRGGLFGGQNDASQAQWQLLARFDKADILAFSTYPAIIYSTPADIPEDYFTEIQQYTSKPIAITENGWFREAPTGWQPSTVETQAEYINRFFKLLPDPKPEFVFWSFLYDPPIASPVFSTMGLLQAGQQTSPAWEAWKLAK